MSAAASLTDVFAAMEEGFEKEHPEVDVVLNLGASSTLRRQIVEGAPVGIFASADLGNMDQVEDAGLVRSDPVVFASNHLQIAVQQGNPTGVADLSDFADEARLIGLCSPGVPCGQLARETLDAAGVAPSLDSEEPNVRALLNKIAIGELDAGIVYSTDVRAEDGVEGIPIPDEINMFNEYVIAALAGAGKADPAEEFVDYVLSPAGRGILEDAGFGLP